MFELKAIELVAAHLRNAVEDGSDPVARNGMAEAQYIAGMGFSNVGLGIVHSMAHPLGAFYDTPHGVANALLLPYVMEYNAESPSRAKYLDIARAMGVDTAGMSVDESVAAAVGAVRDLSLSIGIPQRLHEIGVRRRTSPRWPWRRSTMSARAATRVRPRSGISKNYTVPHSKTKAMNTLLGLLIIAVGSFCQSSSYVPIKKVKEWSWESFWLVQGIFAWLVFPLLGALLAVPAGSSLRKSSRPTPPPPSRPPATACCGVWAA